MASQNMTSFQEGESADITMAYIHARGHDLSGLHEAFAVASIYNESESRFEAEQQDTQQYVSRNQHNPGVLQVASHQQKR